MKKKTVENENIYKDVDKWESREWGAEEEYAEYSPMPKALKNLLNKGNKENAAGKMQLISIRLPESLINDLKNIGKVEGLGYQTLTREVLRRFVEAENRKNLNKALAENRKLEEKIREMEDEIEQLDHQA